MGSGAYRNSTIPERRRWECAASATRRKTIGVVGVDEAVFCFEAIKALSLAERGYIVKSPGFDDLTGFVAGIHKTRKSCG